MSDNKKVDIEKVREAVTRLEQAATYDEQIDSAVGILIALEEAGLAFVPVVQDPRDLAEDIDVACPTNAIRLINEATGDVSLYSEMLEYYEGWRTYRPDWDIEEREAGCACPGGVGCLSEADAVTSGS